VARQEVHEVAVALRDARAHAMRAGDRHQALDQLQWWEGHADTEVMNQLVLEVAKWREWELALDVVQCMPRIRAEPDVITYSTLIGLLGKCGRGKEALQAFEQMQGRGIVPDTLVYGAVIRAATSARDPRTPMALFKRMLEQGVAPNAFVLETVAQVCRATRDADVASTLLRECQENDIQPTDAMVADVIAICSACGQWEAAKGCWDTANSLGIRTPLRYPRGYLSKCELVIAMERAGASAQSVMEEYEPLSKHVARADPATDRRPWEAAEAAVRASWEVPEAFEHAHQVFQRMIAVGYRPALPTYLSMIALCGQAERWGALVTTFQAASSHGCQRLSPGATGDTSANHLHGPGSAFSSGLHQLVAECTSNGKWDGFANAIHRCIEEAKVLEMNSDGVSDADFDGIQRLALPGSALHSTWLLLQVEEMEQHEILSGMQAAEARGFGGNPLIRLAYAHACYQKGATYEGNTAFEQLKTQIESDSGQSARRRRRRQRQRAEKHVIR